MSCNTCKIRFKQVDAYHKTMKVIRSCKTEQHIEVADKMITNFGLLYERNNDWLYLHYALSEQIIKIEQ